MKKIISVLAITLLMSTASAQNTSQASDYTDTPKSKKDGPIIILCMPFPACEELDD